MQQIKLMIAGVLTTISIPGGMQPAHGTGLDGTTKVESLQIGQSPERHPGKHFIHDAGGNSIMGTADEIFAAAKAIALKEGYRLTSTRY